MIEVVRQGEYLSLIATCVYISISFNIYIHICVFIYMHEINFNVHPGLQQHVCRITEVRSCRMGVNIQQLAAR